MSDKHDIKEQVALVTGASRGIGKTIAIALGKEKFWYFHSRFGFIPCRRKQKTFHQDLPTIAIIIKMVTILK